MKDFLYFILLVLVLYSFKLSLFKLLRPLLSFTIFTYLFFTILIIIKNDSINQEVLLESFLKSYIFIEKILILSLMNLIFVFSTTPMLFINTLKKIKLPNNLILSFFIVINILPNIFKRIKTIYTAQRIRGLEFKDFFRLQGWKLFMVPIFVDIFSYSQEINTQLYLKDYLAFEVEDRISDKDLFIFILLILMSILLFF